MFPYIIDNYSDMQIYLDQKFKNLNLTTLSKVCNINVKLVILRLLSIIKHFYACIMEL